MQPRPEALSRVADLLTGFEPSWALCGGWAVDAWLGRQTREHVDVDLTVFEEDHLAVREYLADGWLLNGHDPSDDDSIAPWTGRRLELPAHIHARAEGFELDWQVNRRSGDEWVFDEPGGLTLPISRAIRTSPWGVPVLAPEAVLYYKALGEIRPHDQADIERLLPILRLDQRLWLRDAVAARGPNHPWLEALA